MSRWLLSSVCVCLLGVGGVAATAATGPDGITASCARPAALAVSKRALCTYLAALNAPMKTYRVVAARADAVFQEEPDDLHALIRGLRASRADHARLATRLRAIKAPATLRPAHAGQVKSLGLVAQWFERTALAWVEYETTSNLDDLRAKSEANRTLTAEAAELQARWLRALRTGLARARLPQPAWLKEMGKAESGRGSELFAGRSL